MRSFDITELRAKEPLVLRLLHGKHVLKLTVIFKEQDHEFSVIAERGSFKKPLEPEVDIHNLVEFTV